MKSSSTSMPSEKKSNYILQSQTVRGKDLTKEHRKKISLASRKHKYHIK
jgi:hypothetical protein